MDTKKIAKSNTELYSFELNSSLSKQPIIYVVDKEDWLIYVVDDRIAWPR